MALMRSGPDILSNQRSCPSSHIHLFLLFLNNDARGCFIMKIVGLIIDGALGLSGPLLRAGLISYDIHQCINVFNSVTTWKEGAFIFTRVQC